MRLLHIPTATEYSLDIYRPMFNEIDPTSMVLLSKTGCSYRIDYIYSSHEVKDYVESPMMLTTENLQSSLHMFLFAPKYEFLIVEIY